MMINQIYSEIRNRFFFKFLTARNIVAILKKTLILTKDFE